MSDGFKDIRCLNFCAAKSETDLFSCVLGWLGFVYWDSRHQICCHKLNNMKASVICVISMCWAGWAWYVGVRDINIAAAKRPAWTSVICVISKVIQRCGKQENCPSDVSFIGLIFWIFFLPLVELLLLSCTWKRNELVKAHQATEHSNPIYVSYKPATSTPQWTKLKVACATADWSVCDT